MKQTRKIKEKGRYHCAGKQYKNKAVILFTGILLHYLKSGEALKFSHHS